MSKDEGLKNNLQRPSFDKTKNFQSEQPLTLKQLKRHENSRIVNDMESILTMLTKNDKN